jgi:hypothetical protein
MRRYVLGTLAAVGLALGAITSAANAGPMPLLETLKSVGAEQSAVETVQYGACVWGRYRGWHRNGRYGTWRSCSPGAGWRYERRCWFGPGGVKYCRFN